MLPELARVRVADIEELLARPEEAEKPLSSRERNNLLRVIRALCQQADIDLVNGKGTAQVAKALELAGFDGPKDKTLRALLSEVRKIDKPVITAPVPIGRAPCRERGCK